MDVVVHIGMQKTGSTAIQTGLVAIGDQLTKRNIIYSRAFGKRKAQNLKNVFRPDMALKGGDAASMSAAFAAELARRPDMLILSNENLFSSDRLVMTAIRDAITAGGGTPKIHAYIRRPDEHASSLYQQRIRTGQKTWSRDEFIEQMIYKGYYRYGPNLDRWADVFGHDAVHVRLFHRDTLAGGPFEDFADWIGLSLAGLELSGLRSDTPKESFDTASVEMLRSFHRYSAEHAGALDDRVMAGVLNRVRNSDKSGDRLALSAAQTEKLWNATRADFERLAHRYLSPREAEILLAPTSGPERTTEPGAHDVIRRALDIIGDFDAVLRTPGPDAETTRPLDPPAAELLDILRACATENPDKIGAPAIAKAERLLREPIPEETVPEAGMSSPEAVRPEPDVPSGDYAVFVRLIGICSGLGALAMPRHKDPAKTLLRQQRQEKRSRRWQKQQKRAARLAAPTSA